MSKPDYGLKAKWENGSPYIQIRPIEGDLAGMLDPDNYILLTESEIRYLRKSLKRALKSYKEVRS